MSKFDTLLDTIYQVLPCDSVDDIAKKCKADFRDTRKAIAWLRKHPAFYGWTIPHVSAKHVRDDPTQKGKYFAVILEKDSGKLIDAEKRLHYRRGAHNSLKRVVGLLRHEAQALIACSKNERSPAQRYMLESLVKDMNFVEDKAEHVSKIFGT